MRAEYIHEGKNLDYLNPTDETITAGTVVIIGDICAVAATHIDPGEVGAVATVGVWNMLKDTTSITAGAKVYYDAESDTATATEKETVIGIATADADADAVTVSVRLGG